MTDDEPLDGNCEGGNSVQENIILGSQAVAKSESDWNKFVHKCGAALDPSDPYHKLLMSPTTVISGSEIMATLHAGDDLVSFRGHHVTQLSVTREVRHRVNVTVALFTERWWEFTPNSTHTCQNPSS